MDFNLCSGLC
ncbi:uncharacterized protein CELE_H40L08.8 [Caenorhabditis elegans]|uniref:Uncharacterized protein n=1 Tax=Caenorhabditis elegans TaxID=6239 RepID=A0A2K5AU13_CAEEL|nr:Uncharacterized protein CELE_H40L08.8 [Caenorhabditis elegans]SPC48672.1 Uncharacterized protein CELE_H40L08.8 [Caenorhabditis elegans]|eukprot:NP_001348811.1 Uncharacterized protein CELE_H40L08.8 [Caenorhabditis elegans]